jgi:four helix bundle protein
MKTYSFEKLEVWQAARALTIDVYKLTAKFPSEEKFGIVNQMRRAAVSICSNISEGTSKNTGLEKARYTNISFCSLMELLNQLIISTDLQFMSNDELLEMRTKIDVVALKSTRLRDSQLKMN